MVRLKPEVRPRSLVILAATANVAEELDLVIRVTSGNDSKHMRGSRHYTDEALDLGCKEFPLDVKKSILGRILLRLGPNYQGIIEHLGKPNEHIHIEYDPPTQQRDA